MTHPQKHTPKIWIVLILLVAFFLSTHQLNHIPPGLTHDEANHAQEALTIQSGIHQLYLPLGYGREPMYSYLLAGSMGLLGNHLVVLRGVTVLFHLLTLCITYAWGRKTFGEQTAVLSISLMAFSFWPLAVSREALRSGIMPFFMGGAVFCWESLATSYQLSAKSYRRVVLNVVGLAGCVGATLYIYLAARATWVVFPLFLLYLGLFHRHLFRGVWLPMLVGIGGGWLLSVPMFQYIQAHPEVSTRLDMLQRPLHDLQTGNLAPLLKNGGEAFLAFIWPGRGDHFLAYNLPGRPVLDGISAVFFLIGLFTCLYHWRKPPYAFLLLWFVTGILPSLITGPTANTTRNIAALAPTFLLPAVGFMQVVSSYSNWTAAPSSRPRLPLYAALFWLVFVVVTSARDYFVRWGESPQVRGAYQHTVVEMLRYLNGKTTDSPITISSVYPGPAHDPTLVPLFAPRHASRLRWVDARYALIFPAGRPGYALIPASTPPHPAFAAWLHPLDTVQLRPDDLDPSFTFYQLTVSEMPADVLADFAGAVQLTAVWWQKNPVSPGETAELLTMWHIQNPQQVGPLIPPTFTTDMVLFTHVLKPDGTILAQRDSLEAPSWDWQAGDVVVQLHPVFIPPETPVGLYETAVGLYDRQSGQRLTILEPDGMNGDGRYFIPPLSIENRP